MFYNALRPALAHFLRRHLTIPPRVSGMPAIELLCPLIPCQDDFVSINDNNIVTSIDMRSVEGFVLATQNLGDLAGKASHYLVLCIDNIPLVNDIFLTDGNRMHPVHSCPSPMPDLEGEARKIGGSHLFVKAQHPLIQREPFCALPLQYRK